MTTPPVRIPLTEASKAPLQAGRLSALLLKHGTLEVRFYAPTTNDTQSTHVRDEVYIVATGSGTFSHSGRTVQFTSGDLLFVRAGAEHRFDSFTEDFSTWVIFYGPEGGESPETSITNAPVQPTHEA